MPPESDIRTVLPARRMGGSTVVPPDKSIAHRVALVGGVSDGVTIASNYPSAEDPQSTLRCLEGLGVEVRSEPTGDTWRVEIDGRGLAGLDRPTAMLDAGNSGTTVRLLAGILAAHPFPVTITGDASLSRRPMGRIVDPLERFGARVATTDGHLPMTIHGGRIRGIDYRLGVASAQVKSAVLLAGLAAEGTTTVEEPVRTRNHTELALAAAGASIQIEDRARYGRRIRLEGGHRLTGREITIPGDLSSAAFLMVGAMLVGDSALSISGVGLNPSRADLLSIVERAGARIHVDNPRDEGGEPVGDLTIEPGTLRPLEITPDEIAGLIDELPVLAVLGVCGAGRVAIRGAAELRHKETDRIRALAENLVAIGAHVEEFQDGLIAESPGVLEGGDVSSFGDHRIAMAFAIAGLVCRQGTRIRNPGCADISFPGFYDRVESLVER